MRGGGRRSGRSHGRGQWSATQADDWNVKIKFSESVGREIVKFGLGLTWSVELHGQCEADGE